MSAPPETAAPAGYGRFLARLFDALDRRSVPWCVPRNFAGLPESVAGDVDLLVPRRELERAVALAAGIDKALVVLRRQDKDGHLLLTLASLVELRAAAAAERPAAVLVLDFVTELQWKGLRYLDANEVLGAARPRGGVRVPDERHHAVHLLCHALLDKGRLRPRYRDSIAAALAEAGERALDPLAPFAGTKVVQRLYAAFRRGDEARLVAERRRLIVALAARGPGPPVRATAWLAARGIRLTRALLRPPGVLIATAGPDGVGKTTLLGRVRTVLGDVWVPARDVYMGWKQFLLPTKRLLTALQRRHKPSHGAQTSSEVRRGWTHNLSVVHYLVDLWARYAARVRPVLVRGGLVTCDRYFYDALMQEVAVSEVAWCRRLIVALSPTPTITILFSGDADRIAARKGELSPEATARHMAAVGRLAGRAGVRVVQADAPIEDNVLAVIRELAR